MIPDFQSLMIPILKIANDNKEHNTNEVYNILSLKYGLTEVELNEYVPSGQQRVFFNRVSWAKSYLKMASLIIHTKRSHFKITESGKEILKNIRIL